MRIRLSDEAARRLRSRLAEMGFCDAGVVAAIEVLVRTGNDDLASAVDSILLGEGFEAPDLADRRIWRSIRDAIVAAAHDSSI